MRGFLLILFWALPLFVFGQATLTVDRSEMVIGDQFTAMITTDLSNGRELINAHKLWPDSLESIEVVSGPMWNRTNPAAAVASWKVSVFDTGWIRIPSLSLVVKNGNRFDTLLTNDIPLKVHPVLPDSLGLRDIKGIYEEPFNPAYYKRYIPHVLGVVLLLAALWYWNKRRNSSEAAVEEAQPPPLPDVWAFEALSSLEQKKLWQEGEVKAHYTELTGILREYLERRYNIHAMEQTSDEIILQLEKLKLDRELLQDTEQLLSVADLIKFAKADPGENIHADTIRRVHVFVDQTTPRTSTEEEVNKNDTDAAME